MKTNKMIMSILAFLQVAVVTLSLAQPPPPLPSSQDRKENIEAVKIAFITRELDLTPQEAQIFWPVYNQFQDELEKLRKEKRSERKENKKKLDELSDAEIEKIVDDEIIFQQRELDLRKKYHAEFKKVLPIKKVARLYKAEEDFKREILRRMRDEKRDMPPPR